MFFFLYSTASRPVLGPLSLQSCGYRWGSLSGGKAAGDVKLTMLLHPMSRSRMVELYLHSPLCIHGVMLNYVQLTGVWKSHMMHAVDFLVYLSFYIERIGLLLGKLSEPGTLFIYIYIYELKLKLKMNIMPQRAGNWVHICLDPEKFLIIPITVPSYYYNNHMHKNEFLKHTNNLLCNIGWSFPWLFH
jgi:hypothetical protein